MVRFIRWISLVSLVIILYVMGLDTFHLKHTREFFILVYILCLALTLIFALIGRVERDD